MSSALFLDDGTIDDTPALASGTAAPLLLLLPLIGGKARGLASSTSAADKGFGRNLLRHLVAVAVAVVVGFLRWKTEGVPGAVVEAG